MDDDLPIGPMPEGWLEILSESEAELAIGLTVDGNQIMHELYAAAERLEAAPADEQARKATRCR